MDSDCVSSSYSYNFPYEPYSIQKDLMDKILDALTEEKVGIFSSPTGTGKSLSIICSIFHFIESSRKKLENQLKEQISEAEKTLKDADKEIDEPSQDWVTLHSRKRGIVEELRELKEQYAKYEEFHERNRQLKSKIHLNVSETDKKFQTKKMRKDEVESTDSKETTDDLLVQDSSEDESEDKEVSFEQNEELYPAIKPQVIYCSRTHSQLAQFVSEIKKTVYGERLRVVSLGSRINLCNNPVVKKLKSSNLINDKCLEMQRSSSKKCSFLKKSDLQMVRDGILAHVQDIEEAFSLGCSLKACSYYASRMAVKEAQVLIVPYNILVHRKTRESFGIKLEDSIVVIDEAHNLLDTICSVHGTQIYGSHFLDSLSQLNQYMIRYNKQLSSKNLMLIKHLQFILGCFIKLFHGRPSCNEGRYELFSPYQLLVRIKAEEFNFFRILDFCEASQIARKLLGFAALAPVTADENQDESTSSTGTIAFLKKLKAQKLENKKQKKQPKPTVVSSTTSPSEPQSIGSPLYQVIELFRCITSLPGEGKFLWTRNEDIRSSSLKFLLLDPANQFKDIVEKPRSLILIGGTMEPVSEYIDLLFSPLGVSPNSIINFSCDHVISDEKILPICLGKGPKGKVSLEFTFKTRNNPELFKDVGEILMDISPNIRGGIIVFFPSYEYEKSFFENWSKNGVISKLESLAKKKVFREPKNTNSINKLLLDYSRTIDTMASKPDNHGAILLSVMGGKMSEGINFSDDLGRCVIVVGLPYANINSPELKERMTYLSSREKGLDEAYYENLCLKAINQSIGRVIRHRNDYATIILLDRRYCDKETIRENLPEWIKKRLKICPHYDTASGLIKSFFKDKAKK